MKNIGKIVRYSITKKYSIDSLCIRAAEGKALLVIDGWQIEKDASKPFYIRIDGKEDGVKRSDKKREDVRETFGLPADTGYYSFIGEFSLPPDPSRVFLIEVGREGNKPFFKKSLSIAEMLDEQKEEIICCIDSVQKNGGKTYITGWGYSRALERSGDGLSESLSELDVSLKEGQYFLRREERNDVKVNGFPADQRPGFVLRVEDTKDGIYDLILKAPNGTIRELRADSRMGEEDYREFRKKNVPSKDELLKQSETIFSYSPLISFPVLVYNTDVTALKRTIESVLSQSYINYELCLSDISDDGNEKREKLIYDFARKDKRVRVNDPENKGEFLYLLSSGDTIEPDYLFRVVKALQEEDVDMVYTDEDRFDGEGFFDPNFKSDFSMDLLRGTNFVGNTAVIRKSLLAEGEPLFDEKYKGAEVYDLILRCAERARQISHIKKALYHKLVETGDNKSIPLSEDPEQEAGRRAIEASLQRLHVDGRVADGPEKGLYIMKYALKSKDRISIIIPSHDHASVLRT